MHKSPDVKLIVCIAEICFHAETTKNFTFAWCTVCHGNICDYYNSESNGTVEGCLSTSGNYYISLESLTLKNIPTTPLA